MSENYVKTDYCNLEIEHARLKNKHIVILTKEEVNKDDMNAVTKEIFSHFTRVRLVCGEDGHIRLESDGKTFVNQLLCCCKIIVHRRFSCTKIFEH